MAYVRTMHLRTAGAQRGVRELIATGRATDLEEDHDLGLIAEKLSAQGVDEDAVSLQLARFRHRRGPVTAQEASASGQVGSEGSWEAWMWWCPGTIAPTTDLSPLHTPARISSLRGLPIPWAFPCQGSRRP